MKKVIIIYDKELRPIDLCEVKDLTERELKEFKEKVARNQKEDLAKAEKEQEAREIEMNKLINQINWLFHEIQLLKGEDEDEKDN